MNITPEIEKSLLKFMPLLCAALGPDFKLKITPKNEDMPASFDLHHKSGSVFYAYFNNYKKKLSFALSSSKRVLDFHFGEVRNISKHFSLSNWEIKEVEKEHLTEGEHLEERAEISFPIEPEKMVQVASRLAKRKVFIHGVFVNARLEKNLERDNAYTLECEKAKKLSEQLRQKFGIYLTVNGSSIEIKESFDLTQKERLIQILEIMAKKV